MTDYDSPWKEALDFFFEAFLELFFPQAHADIDWSRGWESLDKELRQIDSDSESGRRYVDKLAKVWLMDGQEQWVLVHVEVQMADESEFPLRMYVYNYRVFDKYNRREVASFAVLGDDNPCWRPDCFVYRRWGTEAGLRFPVVKLLDYAARRAELEQSDNPFATVVLAHLDTQETRQDLGERKDRKFSLVKRLRREGWSEKQVRQLFLLIDWMMDLPDPLADEFWKELKQHEEKEHMPFVSTPERFGRVEGRVEGRKDGIEAILDLRFGAAGTQLMPEVRQIHDENLVEKILKAAKTVASPEELRAIWSADPR